MTDTTDHTDPTPDPIPAPAPMHQKNEPKRSRGRTLLIGGGALLAAAVLVGGGVAVGAAIADDNDDDTASDATYQDDDAGRTDDDAARATDAEGIGDADGSASASELLDIIQTASGEAQGDPVGIEVTNAGSWDVQFSTAAGDESEVRVGPDGTAVVISTEAADQDDQPASGSLDARTLDALVTAALDEVDGTVVGIEIDADAASPYDVSVRTPDRKTVDIALDAKFAVVTADVDESDD